MIDYEKLCNLDYTVYELAEEFGEVVEDAGINEPVIVMDHSYIDDLPVVDLTATEVHREVYAVDSYEMPGVTEEEFEEVMHELWVSCLQDEASSLSYTSVDKEVVQYS